MRVATTVLVDRQSAARVVQRGRKRERPGGAQDEQREADADDELQRDRERPQQDENERERRPEGQAKAIPRAFAVSLPPRRKGEQDGRTERWKQIPGRRGNGAEGRHLTLCVRVRQQ